MMKRFALLLPLLLAACANNVRFASHPDKTSSGERGIPRQEMPTSSYPESERPIPRPDSSVQAPEVSSESPDATVAGEKIFQEGIASYYAHAFNGRKTANGEIFNMNDYTAAHRTLPFNTRVRVENKQNGKSVIVRVNDRGPYAKARIIDLSLSAAKSIDLIKPGSAPVTLYIVENTTP